MGEIRLSLERTGHFHFMGFSHKGRRWGFYAWWVAETEASNLVWVRALEFRLAWPPVLWVGQFEPV